MADYIQKNEIIDDRYKIYSSLGEGGMAVVMKAHDLISHKDVAIKMLKPEGTGSQVTLARFDREARAAACLNHPNIVKIVNVGFYKSIPYIVNEFVDGQNLRQVLDYRGKFSFLEACDIIYQLCSAVSYAHSQDIIHRDIKPANIYLTRDGTIKLGDFGIAIFNTKAAHVTRSSVVVGTVQYIAPEISGGNPATFKSDIYSIGITFFELITGRVPYDGDSNLAIAIAHIEKKFPSIQKFNPKAPEAIAKIIYKATEKDPNDRYVSVDVMKKDIEKIIKDPSLLEKKPSFFSRLFHPSDSDKQERNKKKMLKEAAKQAEKEIADGK